MGWPGPRCQAACVTARRGGSRTWPSGRIAPPSSKKITPFQSRHQPCSGCAARTCAVRASNASAGGQQGTCSHMSMSPQPSSAASSTCLSGTHEPFAAYVTPPPQVSEPQSIIAVSSDLRTYYGVSESPQVVLNTWGRLPVFATYFEPPDAEGRGEPVRHRDELGHPNCSLTARP
jgi:hypothetical protein